MTSETIVGVKIEGKRGSAIEILVTITLSFWILNRTMENSPRILKLYNQLIKRRELADSIQKFL